MCDNDCTVLCIDGCGCEWGVCGTWMIWPYRRTFASSCAWMVEFVMSSIFWYSFWSKSEWERKSKSKCERGESELWERRREVRMVKLVCLPSFGTLREVSDKVWVSAPVSNGMSQWEEGRKTHTSNCLSSAPLSTSVVDIVVALLCDFETRAEEEVEAWVCWVGAKKRLLYRSFRALWAVYWVMGMILKVQSEKEKEDEIVHVNAHVKQLHSENHNNSTTWNKHKFSFCGFEHSSTYYHPWMERVPLQIIPASLLIFRIHWSPETLCRNSQINANQEERRNDTRRMRGSHLPALPPT